MAEECLLADGGNQNSHSASTQNRVTHTVMPHAPLYTLLLPPPPSPILSFPVHTSRLARRLREAAGTPPILTDVFRHFPSVSADERY